MKVVITGGAGFIGSNLARALGERSGISEIIVIDDFSFGFRSNLDIAPRATLVEGSILDDDLLDRTFEGAAQHRQPGGTPMGLEETEAWFRSRS